MKVFTLFAVNDDCGSQIDNGWEVLAGVQKCFVYRHVEMTGSALSLNPLATTSPLLTLTIHFNDTAFHSLRTRWLMC